MGPGETVGELYIKKDPAQAKIKRTSDVWICCTAGSAPSVQHMFRNRIPVSEPDTLPHLHVAFSL